MYQIYVEQLTGQRFVGDEDVVTMKLAVLNERMGATGKLSLKEYCDILQLKQFGNSDIFKVPKNVMFLFRPSEIGGVPITVIEAEQVDYMKGDV